MPRLISRAAYADMFGHAGMLVRHPSGMVEAVLHRWDMLIFSIILLIFIFISGRLAEIRLLQT
jgi:hypothetical protein